MTQPQHPEPGTHTPESAKEGDIDDDRQDAPEPEKTEGDEHLDGFKPTPGDEAARD